MSASRSAAAMPPRSPSSRRTRRHWTALLAAGSVLLNACYSYHPVVGTPAPGMDLVLDLNDRGRVVLGDSIGPAAETVQGVLETVRDSQYVLRVSSIRYLNGQANEWSGESLGLRTDLIGRARERRFSRVRTWAVVAGAAAAVLAVVLSTNLATGSGDDSGHGGPPNPPGGQ